MPLRVTIHADRVPLTAEDGSHLCELLVAASTEARVKSILSAVLLEADNGNVMTFVVGSDETVLGFDLDHGRGPYYASRGPSDSDDPALTCYLNFRHHTEFPRKYVIPFEDGMRAATEFLGSGGLPSCINWEEV